MTNTALIEYTTHRIVHLERLVFSLAFVRAVVLTIDLLQCVVVPFRSTGVCKGEEHSRNSEAVPRHSVRLPSPGRQGSEAREEGDKSGERRVRSCCSPLSRGVSEKVAQTCETIRDRSVATTFGREIVGTLRCSHPTLLG